MSTPAAGAAAHRKPTSVYRGEISEHAASISTSCLIRRCAPHARTNLIHMRSVWGPQSNTDVLIGVKAEIGEPEPQAPNMGLVHFYVNWCVLGVRPVPLSACLCVYAGADAWTVMCRRCLLRHSLSRASLHAFIVLLSSQSVSAARHEGHHVLTAAHARALAAIDAIIKRTHLLPHSTALPAHPLCSKGAEGSFSVWKWRAHWSGRSSSRTRWT